MTLEDNEELAEMVAQLAMVQAAQQRVLAELVTVVERLVREQFDDTHPERDNVGS